MIKFSYRALGATLALAILTTGVLLAPQAQAAGKGKRAKKTVLVVTVTKGFRHDSIPLAEETPESPSVSRRSRVLWSLRRFTRR